MDIFRKLPGELPTKESAADAVEKFAFGEQRYDLARVGRHKVNKKLRCMSWFPRRRR